MAAKLKFTCQKCGTKGAAACSRSLPFLHCSWYRDYKGLTHGCLYCRSCGVVYDTVGSLVALIRLLLSRMPSKAIGVYEFSELRKIAKINNPDLSGLRSMNPYIISAMIEDGRLTGDEDLIGEEPAVDFLLECLKDENYVVRREAIVSLGRLKDKRAVVPLIEALGDKNCDLRRHAASTLGDMGDSRAVERLNELLATEKWERLVRKEAKTALEKLRGQYCRSSW